MDPFEARDGELVVDLDEAATVERDAVEPRPVERGKHQHAVGGEHVPAREQLDALPVGPGQRPLGQDLDPGVGQLAGDRLAAGPVEDLQGRGLVGDDGDSRTVGAGRDATGALQGELVDRQRPAGLGRRVEHQIAHAAVVEAPDDLGERAGRRGPERGRVGDRDSLAGAGGDHQLVVGELTALVEPRDPLGAVDAVELTEDEPEAERVGQRVERVGPDRGR